MLKKILLSLFGLIGLFIISFLLFYNFWFLRLPDRVAPNDESIFLSPANGTVMGVQKWVKDTLKVLKGDLGAIQVLTEGVGDSGTIVSIEMNLNSVHYQRAPIKSTLISEKYTEGAFNNALVHINKYGMRFENEHNMLFFESARGTRYKIVQIAGFVARRIVDYVENKQSVEQGEVIGLIKLGSQVTVILPHHVSVEAEKGDYLIEGESILARE